MNLTWEKGESFKKASLAKNTHIGKTPSKDWGGGRVSIVVFRYGNMSVGHALNLS